MLNNYRLAPETKGEEDLLRFIENHIEDEKDMVLAIIKGMRDNPDTGSNNAGKCYEGCPPQIGDDFLDSWIEELNAPEKELFLLFWVKENDSGTKMFSESAQTRMTNIKNSKWYDEKIHKVHCPPIQNFHEIDKIIKNWTKYYGGNFRIKTREVGVFSHSGGDGPIAYEARHNPPVVNIIGPNDIRTYYSQMAVMGGWDNIDFNWKDNDSIFVAYGCNSYPFAESISQCTNFNNVIVGGQSDFSYPSMYPDYQVLSTARAIIGRDLRKYSYMVARLQGQGWDTISFNPFKGDMDDEQLTDFPKTEDVFFFKNGSSYLDSHQGIFNDHRKPENNINF